MPRPASHKLVLACANSAWNLRHFRGNLLRNVQKAGFMVHLVAPAPATEVAGIGKPVSLPMRNDSLNPVADAALFLRLLQLMWSLRPDAYLSWTAKPNIYGALAARLLNIPAFPNVSGLGTAFIKGGLLQSLLSTMYRLSFAAAPAVFFQNQEDLDYFVERKLVRREQARLLPGSGVDLTFFTSRPLPQRPNRETVFLFVGRLLGDKGVRELVEAARLLRSRYPEVRVQLLGPAGVENRTAIDLAELDGWLKEGIVEYLGPKDDVRPFLADADAIILPSYREGMPRSLLEAAATGRPLLASDVPGNREVVEHGRNGFLFKVRSANAIAEACERFIALSPAERQGMADEARQTVEDRFSEEQVIVAYMAALSEPLDGLADSRKRSDA